MPAGLHQKYATTRREPGVCSRAVPVHEFGAEICAINFFRIFYGVVNDENVAVMCKYSISKEISCAGLDVYNNMRLATSSLNMRCQLLRCTPGIA